MAHLTGKVHDVKLEMTATKSDVAHLTRKSDNFNNNITTQMRSFAETVSAQMSVLNTDMASRDAKMDSRVGKFEDRFLFRMLFAVSGLLRICYILLSNNCEGI
jgi:hypothetical protein